MCFVPFAEVSDYIFGLVFLTILTLTHSVFGAALPTVIDSNGGKMSLENELRSPCRAFNAPKEELTRGNVKDILQLIANETVRLKDASIPIIANYVSKFMPNIFFLVLTIDVSITLEAPTYHYDVTISTHSVL